MIGTMGLMSSLLTGTPVEAAKVLNGFELNPTSVRTAEIVAGGPTRDGIPALDHPPVLRASSSDWPADEIVLAIVIGDAARAYPISILDWHELVNDTLGGEPILVSYCPLCGTGLVFDRRVAGRARRFGVSGLLYRSDLLMYDRETDSLWSQIAAEAVVGPLLGERLRILRSTVTTWGVWLRDQPKSTILSRRTGFRSDYDHSPYGRYAETRRLLFPVRYERRYHPKMPTLGLRVFGVAERAYPSEEILRAGGSVVESFLGHRVAVRYDDELERFDVEAPVGIEVVEGFWFAWSAFHPKSSVFQAPAARPQ